MARIRGDAALRRRKAYWKAVIGEVPVVLWPLDAVTECRGPVVSRDRPSSTSRSSADLYAVQSRR
jgi:hypothetical protein